MTILQASDISKVYGNGDSANYVLNDINFKINAGEMVAFKGRSGSGKTTLLNILATLDRPTHGTVYFGEQSLFHSTERELDLFRRSHLGLIFQSYALMPMMSALENVDFGLRIAGFPLKRRSSDALWAIEQVGLKKRMHHMPVELSGGEQQRVAIARAIAHRPKIVLADEPTSELDSKTGIHMIQILKELVQSTGMTVIFTSHDPIMWELADRVFELEDGNLAMQS